jgi:hypothetical protein
VTGNISLALLDDIYNSGGLEDDGINVDILQVVQNFFHELNGALPATIHIGHFDRRFQHTQRSYSLLQVDSIISTNNQIKQVT